MEPQQNIDITGNQLPGRSLEDLIFTVRNVQVMLDFHLAGLYGVETKRLNEQVKRNRNRFPEKFMFQLSKEEWETIRSQIATLETNRSWSQFATIDDKRGRHSKYWPYVFTEQGVAMLSAVLRSETAVAVSIAIMNAFVGMRNFLLVNAQLFHRLSAVEKKQLQNEEKFEQIFRAIEEKSADKKQGIFFDGQIYDAFSFIVKLIKKAVKEIVLIDGYVSNEVLDMLTKKQENVTAIIYTFPKSQLNDTDIKRFNAQYPTICVRNQTIVHDRFLLIDRKEIYCIGASLKDAGKKCFAFTRIDDNSRIFELLERIEP